LTALLYAAREGCVDCARALVDAGADPDLADPERVTPLNMAL
jgi:ankyrin repeat protein